MRAALKAIFGQVGLHVKPDYSDFSNLTDHGYQQRATI